MSGTPLGMNRRRPEMSRMGVGMSRATIGKTRAQRAFALLVPVFAGCSLLGVASEPAKSACETELFQGFCFDLRLNDQDVLHLADDLWLERFRSRSLTPTQQSALADVHWAVPKAIHGPLAAHASPRADGGLEWFGSDLAAINVLVTPLGDYGVPSKKELAPSENVRTGEQGVLTEREVLVGNELPPGEYVLTVRVRGIKRWDKKDVLLTVE